MDLLKLPCERTMQREMSARTPSAGDDNTLLRLAMEHYEQERRLREREWLDYERAKAGADVPAPLPKLTGEVILLFDEVGLGTPPVLHQTRRARLPFPVAAPFLTGWHIGQALQ